MGFSKYYKALFFASLILASAPTANAVEPGAPEELLSKDAAIAGLVREAFSDPKKVRNAKLRERYLDYYTSRDFSPIWIGRDGLSPHAKQIVKEIKRADEYGLTATDYKLPDLTAISSPESLSLKTLADTEVTLSIAAVKYARDARGGRITPRAVSRNLDFTLKLPSPKAVLDGIAKSKDAGRFLRKFHPQRREFEALRKKYVALIGGSAPQQSSSSGPQIPDGPTLREGDTHRHVAILRKRLKVSAGIIEDDHHFDDAVARAVKDFQRENGLTPDGIVGRGTKAALNGTKRRSPGGEASRLLVNMERWRWYPNNFGKRYIYMNIPEQQVRVFKDGKMVHKARTIIGKLKNPTVVFSDKMEHIVFHPGWSMPNSIKVHEILPYLQKNTGWLFSNDSDILKRHNLFIRDKGRDIDPSKINWKQVDIRKFQIYQPPGPKNVLGIVKFMFPNRHAIYMHDTIEKHYFKQPVRMHSHGCVRIQNADQFASVLLNVDKGWSSSRVQRIIASGRHNNTIRLSKHIPVHITYFTAWVDDNGKLQTRQDVYGHDRRMARALRTGTPAQSAPKAVASFFNPKPKPKPKKKKKKQEQPSLMSILNAF